MNEWRLDEYLTSELRAAVQESNLYRFDEKVKTEYSLICAVADRVQDADRWLNDHAEFPTDEVVAQTWLMLSSVVKSSVEALCRRFKIDFGDNDAGNAQSHKYFGDVCSFYGLQNDDQSLITDNDFFQYFRSLTFSHPYGTRKGNPGDNRCKNYPFLDQDETLYAPYLVLEKDPYEDCFEGVPVIGVHIYSNKRDDIKSLFVPFESLKSFVLSRHNRLVEVSNALRKRVEDAERKFRAERFDREASSAELFEDIKKTLESRGCDTYAINNAISYLECPSTCLENDDAVRKYKQAILALAPALCDEIEKLNYEDFTRRLSHLTECQWHTLPEGVSYSSQKIYEYFNGHSEKREWGRADIDLLMDDYVGKWVRVRFDMPDLEIRMLVSLAYYMEFGRYRKVELFADADARRNNSSKDGVKYPKFIFS